MEFLQQLLGQSEWTRFQGYFLPVGFKVIVSILCGGLIGLERELKHKPAGLRTNILICLGANLFTTLSVIIAENALPGHPGDPARIAAQVVSGVGFLGGGMIIQSGGSVLGLTSAATVWVVAAIGVCIGLGYPIMACMFTVTVFFTLYFLSKVDNRIFGKLQSFETNVWLQDMDASARAHVMEAFQKGDLELTRLSVTEHDGRYKITAKYYAPESRHLRVHAALWGVTRVDKIDVKIH